MPICARRFAFAVFLFAAGTTLASAWQSSAPGAPTPVSIMASVLSKNGIFVPGLTKDEFEVFDNGKRQVLTSFENKVQPIALVVLVDRSGTLGWDPTLVWQAAERLVAASVRPGDTARAGTFSSKIIIAPPNFTDDKDAITQAFAESIQGAGPSPLWNAASAAIDALAAQPGRRILMIVSENRDAPGTPGGATLVDVRARAQANDIVVYAIGLAAPAARGALAPMSASQQGRGRSSSSSESGSKAPGGAGMPDPGLKSLTSETGGDYFEFESGISVPVSFESIADELHHQYVLAFMPAALDGKVHTIEVRVKRPGATVLARKSYVASPGK
jgi:Ca-activated chloride channel family protein